MTSICDLSAIELVGAYRKKELSPVDAMRAIFDRIDLLDAKINAFRETDRAGALAAAAESETRWRSGKRCGVLDGVPVSVKDLVATKGMATLYGSKAVSPGNSADADAPSVALLRSSGAIIFGKTTTSEFGNKIVTESPLTGVTRNPWNLEKTAGGSSGGSGAAVAAGMGPLALATDGGGSIRIPSCWSGTFGFKPSFKRVPSDGSDIFSLSNIGPITRSVGDAALMMTVLTGHCDSDFELSPARQHDFQTGLEDGVRNLRIAFSPDLGLVKVTDDIASCVDQAVRTLEQLGARVEQVSVPPLRSYLESRCHSIQWMVRIARLVRDISPEQRELLDPDTSALAAIGEEIPTSVLVEAMTARQRLSREMHQFFDRFDLLVTPTFHVTAPDVPGLPPHLQTAPPLTSWCNQTMQPAASIPCGLTSEKMPVGLQIIGRRFADALVLRAARAYEGARGPFPVSPLVASIS